MKNPWGFPVRTTICVQGGRATWSQHISARRRLSHAGCPNLSCPNAAFMATISCLWSEIFVRDVGVIFFMTETPMGWSPTEASNLVDFKWQWKTLAVSVKLSPAKAHHQAYNQFTIRGAVRADLPALAWDGRDYIWVVASVQGCPPVRTRAKLVNSALQLSLGSLAELPMLHG